jgi:hypothetical protein
MSFWSGLGETIVNGCEAKAPLVPEIAEAISHVDTDARTHPLFQGSKQTLGREAIDQRVKTDLPR